MTKTITLRLNDPEYQKISSCAQNEHRPISNLILHLLLEKIEDSTYADSIEMAQIKTNETLLKKLKRGHQEAQEIRKGSR